MRMLLLGEVCPTDITSPLFEKKDISTLFGNVYQNGLFGENYSHLII